MAAKILRIIGSVLAASASWKEMAHLAMPEV